MRRDDDLGVNGGQIDASGVDSSTFTPLPRMHSWIGAMSRSARRMKKQEVVAGAGPDDLSYCCRRLVYMWFNILHVYQMSMDWLCAAISGFQLSGRHGCFSRMMDAV